MGSSVTPLVDVAWLAERRNDPQVIVADCRFALTDDGEPPAGAEHIPGAVFFDLERDLSGSLGKYGGRHPLPDVDKLAETLGRRGISRSATVVCYEDQPGQGAARLWWLLRWLGMENVALLDGGFRAWVAAGQPVSTTPVKRDPVSFVPDVQHQMMAPLDEVRSMVKEGRGLLVDVRAPERYRGETEPLDPVAGSIPGAVNYPWMETITSEGFYKDKETLARQFASLPVGNDTVIYCGSGVTACYTLLALEALGRSGARLYPGGWSEWCRLPEDERPEPAK